MEVTKITNDNFEEEVLKSTVPVILDFWACLLYTSPSPRDRG